MVEKHMDPKSPETKNWLENFDIELAERLDQNALSDAPFASILHKLVDHNLACPSGYEISLELSMKQGEGIFERLASLDTSVEVAMVAGAYATCGLLHEGILIEFEEHLLS